MFATLPGVDEFGTRLQSLKSYVPKGFSVGEFKEPTRGQPPPFAAFHIGIYGLQTQQVFTPNWRQPYTTNHPENLAQSNKITVIPTLIDLDPQNEPSSSRSLQDGAGEDEDDEGWSAGRYVPSPRIMVSGPNQIYAPNEEPSLSSRRAAGVPTNPHIYDIYHNPHRQPPLVDGLNLAPPSISLRQEIAAPMPSLYQPANVPLRTYPQDLPHRLNHGFAQRSFSPTPPTRDRFTPNHPSAGRAPQIYRPADPPPFYYGHYLGPPVPELCSRRHTDSVSNTHVSHPSMVMELRAVECLRRHTDYHQYVREHSDNDGYKVSSPRQSHESVRTGRAVRWSEDLIYPPPVPSPQRRKGWFNRRGDQLWTNSGAYKPPWAGQEYPPDLAEYPEHGEGWMNEKGVRIDMRHRLLSKARKKSMLKGWF